jgi:hypothetical protein
LWPRHDRPDVLLSIGTGVEKQFGKIPEEIPDRAEQTKWHPLAYIKRLRGIVTHQIEMNMNSQKAWKNFVAKHQSELTPDELQYRYFRLNVEFPDRVPKLDQVGDLDSLQSLATSFCEANKQLIRSAAAKLVASLFYLKVNKIFTKEKRAKYQVQGWYWGSTHTSHIC